MGNVCKNCGEEYKHYEECPYCDEKEFIITPNSFSVSARNKEEALRKAENKFDKDSLDLISPLDIEEEDF